MIGDDLLDIAKIKLLIIKNKAKLDKLIAEDAPYEKILHQSQIVDKYLVMQIQAELKQ